MVRYLLSTTFEDPTGVLIMYQAIPEAFTWTHRLDLGSPPNLDPQTPSPLKCALNLAQTLKNVVYYHIIMAFCACLWIKHLIQFIKCQVKVKYLHFCAEKETKVTSMHVYGERKITNYFLKLQVVCNKMVPNESQLACRLNSSKCYNFPHRSCFWWSF